MKRIILPLIACIVLLFIAIDFFSYLGFFTHIYASKTHKNFITFQRNKKML